MNKVAWALVLGAALGSSAAHAIVFTSTSFSTDANVIAGIAMDDDSKTSALSPPVLKSTAQVNTGADSSFGDATADSLFLVANSKASSSAETATAVATAGFIGDFLFPVGSCTGSNCGTKILLSIGFDAQGKATGSATAENTLAVTLFGDGGQLFNQVFSNPGKLDLSIDVPFGTQLGNLDLTLISTSDATIGTAVGLSSASFNVTVVPEPATWALLASGILLLLCVHRRLRAM